MLMTASNSTLTQDELKKNLHYNPETGLFTRLASKNGNKIGSIAGHVQKNKCGKSYIRIKINGTKYMAHLLVWLYVYGHFPLNKLDHINGNGINNWFSNLREATDLENARNQRKYSNNQSGCTGVFWKTKHGKWCSVIGVEGKIKHLGYFGNIFDAACVRKSAENKNNFHINHGSDRPL